MRFIPFVLASLVAIALAALSLSAFAAMQYQSERFSVRLLDDPCPVIELAYALSNYGPAKLAAVTIDGALSGACWTKDGDKILIADVFGNSGYLAATDFKSVD